MSAYEKRTLTLGFQHKLLERVDEQEAIALLSEAYEGGVYPKDIELINFEWESVNELQIINYAGLMWLDYNEKIIDKIHTLQKLNDKAKEDVKYLKDDVYHMEDLWMLQLALRRLFWTYKAICALKRVIANHEGK